MSIDDILQLQEPLTDGGIRSVNFFNGRLLAGKDFSREQDARREADARLGLALGEGVAFGLQVIPEKNSAIATVKAGLAFNSQGQALRLTNDVQLALASSFEATSVDCLFKNCSVLLGGGTYMVGAGAYVLTIAPASISEGRAATNGFDPTNVRCNTDATVDAVQFHLRWINPTLYADLNVTAASFRNELVYRCFGAGVQPTWFENLMDAAPRQDDLLETLRKTVLKPVEVPLGLVFFKGLADLQFIDVWAVRRPLSRPSDAFASLVDGRRLAVGQAMFQQFQAQIADLASPTDGLGNVTAQAYFRYLPPVGIIPVAKETNDSDAQATKFFTGMTYRSPVFINAARVESLVRDSLYYPPIDTQSREMLWLYRVRENRMAIDFAANAPLPRSYLIFASGHLPYIGDAQFDLAHWNYSNYVL